MPSAAASIKTEPHSEPMQGARQNMPVPCAGCGGDIIDRFYLMAVDRKWHANCLRCSECKVALDATSTCFARDGSIYCKEDYYRRFAMKKCARCHVDISSNELVMKARQFVYHLHCFSCCTCHKVLSTGEYFGMRDEVLYCKTHYDNPNPPSPNMIKMPHEFLEFHTGNGTMHPGMDGFPGMPSAHVQGQQGPPPFYNGVGATQKGRPRKRKNQQHDLGLMCDVDEMTLTADGLMCGTSRQKRIRTSFKHAQLRVLKNYFALNQNPDAKDLKQLAHKTGLPKRVLQVWFQNARAKYRRNVTKQQNDPQSSSKNGSNSDNPDGSPSNNQSMDSSDFPDLPDMRNMDIRNSRSPTAMSDLSSTPSLSDLHPGNHCGRDQRETGSSFSDLFTHVTAGMNGFV